MKYKRFIAKLGTNLLTGGTGRLDNDVMSNLVEQIAQLHEQGHEVIIVSSGAIAAGRQKLGLTDKRRDVAFKQVLASVGQNQLMQKYEQLFNKHKITTAQALLTKSDISDRAGYLNARNTLLALIELRVICIVNENDVVATDELGELKFGDNDNLSAMVANLVDADLLVILTDINGLYTADPQRDPRAKLVEKVEIIDMGIERIAKGSCGKYGVGGMVTKVEAAKLATSSGVTVIIANGRETNILKRILQGEAIGTMFLPRVSQLESKKRWMLSRLASRGKLIIDRGAVKALVERNSSLLPAGVVTVEGRFRRGDLIDIHDLGDNHIGCGISNYNSKDIAVIRGAHSEEISRLLGHEYGDEIVHRDNMVMV